jgi:hypothetical protein
VDVRARVKARRVLAERLQKPFKLPKTAFVGAYSTITTTDTTSSTIPDDNSTYPLWEDDISITHQSWAQPCQLQPDTLTFVLHDFPDTTQDHHVKSTLLVEDITRSIPDHFASIEPNELTFIYADVATNDTDKLPTYDHHATLMTAPPSPSLIARSPRCSTLTYDESQM